MLRKLNHLLDVLANFFAQRKGLLPIIAMLVVAVNFLLQFYPGSGWMVETDFLLHLGLIIAIFGFLLAWAL